MDLSALGFGLINLFISLFLSPLYEGVARKLRATVHSRLGPPLWQPYFDLLKLLGKEDLRTAKGPLLTLAPVACLGAVALAGLLIPMGPLDPPLAAAGDAILLIYVVALAVVALTVAGAVSQGPFAFISLSREIMMHLVVEPVLAISLVAVAVKAHSLKVADMVSWHYLNGPTVSTVTAAVFLFLALQAQVGKLPFDIAEAEQEVMGGSFIEQSGPRYALLRWAVMAKQIVFCSIFVQVFVPWPRTGQWALDIAIHLAKVLVLVIIIAVVDVVNPRLRIDQAVRYYLNLLLFSLSSVAFAIIGV